MSKKTKNTKNGLRQTLKITQNLIKEVLKIYRLKKIKKDIDEVLATWSFVPVDQTLTKKFNNFKNKIHILGNSVFWNATQSVALFKLWKNFKIQLPSIIVILELYAAPPPS